MDYNSKMNRRKFFGESSKYFLGGMLFLQEYTQKEISKILEIFEKVTETDKNKEYITKKLKKNLDGKPGEEEILVWCHNKGNERGEIKIYYSTFETESDKFSTTISAKVKEISALVDGNKATIENYEFDGETFKYLDEFLKSIAPKKK